MKKNFSSRKTDSTSYLDFIPPSNFDRLSWCRRWDRMQDHYLIKRIERFETIIRAVREVAGDSPQVLDLGCGTGSLMAKVLQVLPAARVCGVDFDPAVLWLAEARLAEFGDRFSIIPADLRSSGWLDLVPQKVNAVISATALHWLTADQLEKLYHDLNRVLVPWGIFLNADHVRSDSTQIQQSWEKHREEMRREEANSDSEDWDTFWMEYSNALGLNLGDSGQRVLGGWDGGMEEGLSLCWHFDKLKQAGFIHLDCFWRCDCDAVYGGIKRSIDD